jgi:PhzF family phenazine biosynthesis protein
MIKPLEMFQVDAFTSDLFAGNPAAVLIVEQWLDDKLMQAIATENNLAETAFVKVSKVPGEYDLRWFTPTHEVAFCGHATLASAHVLAWEKGMEGPGQENGLLCWLQQSPSHLSSITWMS